MLSEKPRSDPQASWFLINPSNLLFGLSVSAASYPSAWGWNHSFILFPHVLVMNLKRVWLGISYIKCLLLLQLEWLEERRGLPTQLPISAFLSEALSISLSRPPSLSLCFSLSPSLPLCLSSPFLCNSGLSMGSFSTWASLGFLKSQGTRAVGPSTQLFRASAPVSQSKVGCLTPCLGLPAIVFSVTNET